MPARVKEIPVEARLPPPWQWPRSAYVHVPFCAHKCGYCDFAVVAGKDYLADRYLDALEKEMAVLLDRPQWVETLFIGGGTPTQLEPPQLERLLKIVKTWFHWREPPGEFSVEANPSRLTEEKLDILASSGVNRLSLGVQSFQPHVLKVLERDHRAEEVENVVRRTKVRFTEISLDLIFGVPGQTLEQWRNDLERAIELETTHISTYGLTYEKGTRLWKQREARDVQALDEELEREMYAMAMDLLESAGFEQYEISNFAWPGHRCRHNEAYWANEAYFGFGVGAARYAMGRRETTTRDTGAYIRKILAGESAVQHAEELPPEERARETAMTQIRRMDGIDFAHFQQQTGHAIEDLAGPAIHRLIEAGWLRQMDGGIRLTREGKFVADYVCQQWWAQ